MSVFKFGWLSKRRPLTQNRFGHRDAAGQRVQPQVEQLEERLTPQGSVHDITSGGDFSTIQAAVNAANPGDVIQVDPGIYAEQVTISFSLTLEGAQAGNNPNTRFATFTNGPDGPKANPALESIVTAPTVQATGSAPYNDLFVVLSDNVTIDGFVFDGNNPNLNQANAAHLGGVNIDGQDAISNYVFTGSPQPINNLVSEFNIFQNFGRSGITLDNGAAAGPAVMHTIEDNVFANIGNDAGESASDIAMLNNAAASVQANTINVAGHFTGLQLQNFSKVSQNPTISNNTFSVGQDAAAIDVNNVSSSGTSVNVVSNTIDAAAGVFSSDANGLTLGIRVTNVQSGATVTLFNNAIGNLFTGGTFDRGIDLWNDSNGVTVGGGSIGQSRVGIDLDSVDPFFGGTPSSTATTANVTGVAISGAAFAGIFDNAEPLTTNTFSASPNSVNSSVNLNLSGGTIANCAIGVLVETVNAGIYGAGVQISGGADIVGGTTGVKVNGPTATLAFTPNPPASFSGQSGDYITLANDAMNVGGVPTVVDMSQVSFDGFVGANNNPPTAVTLPMFYAVENKLTDFLDDGTLGYFLLTPGQEFVTARSEDANIGALSRAVSVANTGDTINVSAGAFASNVVVSKPLTFLGAQAGQSASARYSGFVLGPNGAKADPNVETVVTVPTVSPFSPPPFNDVFQVTADNVTINGFVIDGNNPALNQSGNSMSNFVNIDGQDGIANYNNVGLPVPISNLVVVNDIIQNFSLTGISLNNFVSGPSATSATIQGDVISNIGNNSGQKANGVILSNDAFAAITNNTILVPALATGIRAQNFSFGTSAMTWSGNTVNVGQDATGIAVNSFFSGTSVINITNNTVNAAGGVNAGDGNGLTWGIVVDSVSGAATVALTGNTIGNLGGGGTFDRGIDFWNDSTSNPVTALGGSIGNSQVGIELDSVDPFQGSTPSNLQSTVNVSNVAISGAASEGVFVDAEPVSPNTFGVSPNTVNNSVSLNLSGGSITNSAVGVLVETVSAGSFTAKVLDQGNTSISGGTTGIRVNGPNAILAFTGTNPPVSFSGQTGDYITLANGALSSSGVPTVLDVSQVNFGGFIGATNNPPNAGTLPLFYALENKITDYLDDGTLGYLSLAPGKEFVTQQSEATNAGALARAAAVASTGDTVNVQAGTFVSNVLVNKPMTILGAQVGQSASIRYAAFVSGANGPKANPGTETVLTVPTVNPFASPPFNDIFLVTSDNVTINGFVLDGNNPALNQSGATQANGINIDGEDGITTYNNAGAAVPVSNLVVTNNIIQNFALSGISLDNGSGGPAATNSTIQANVISNNGNSANQPAFGVILYDNAFASITNNTIIVPAFATGIQAQSFLAGTANMGWSGNTVTVGQDATGIAVNQLASPNSVINISANAVNAAAGVTAGDANGLTWGIAVISVEVTASVTLTGNTIGSLGGAFDRGLDFWNDSTSNPVTVVGGSVSHSNVGMELDNVDPFQGGTVSNSTVNASNLAISGATTAGVLVDAQPLNPNTFGASPNTVSGNVSLNLSAGSILNSPVGVLVETMNAGVNTAKVQLSNGVTISNGTTGIELNGANASLSSTGAIPPAILSGQSGDYITLANGAMSSLGNPTTLDVSGFSFGGFIGANNNPPTASTLPTYYALENRVTDYLDNGTLGYLSFNPAQVFVTTQSEATNAGAVGRGTTAANSGATVNVQAGVFAGLVNITKPLTLLGAGNGSNPASNTILESSINGITINSLATTVNGVTLQNLNINGAGTDLAISNKVTGTNLFGIALNGTGVGLAYSGTVADTLNLGNTDFAGSLSNYITSSSANAITANGTVFNGDPGATLLVSVTGASSFTLDYKANPAVAISNTPTLTYTGSSPGSTLVLENNFLIVKIHPGFALVGSESINYTNVNVVNLNDATAIETIGGPNTAARSTAFAGLTPDERFVQALYLDDLGRAGSKGELDGWVTVLHAAGGSQLVVATDIEHSFEAQDYLVKSWYLAFLGRPATGGEEVSWVNMLMAGQTEEQVLSAIFSTPEYFGRAQTLYSEPTANENYVQALYHDLLGRTGSLGELTGWTNQIPAIGLQGVALGILTSMEFRTYQFESYYEALLRRPGEAAGLTGWVNSGLNIGQVRIDFEGSNEFYTNG